MSLSRIGKLPIEIPGGVTVSLDGGDIVTKGPKGELRVKRVTDVEVAITDGRVDFTLKSDTPGAKSRHGLVRALVQNAVTGVSEGFKKELELHGVGHRVNLSGKALKLSLGFSHEITYTVPEGIEINVEGNKITVSGHDKELVGQAAATIRAFKKPEPYKGKGIRYSDEYIIRKTGKAAA